MFFASFKQCDSHFLCTLCFNWIINNQIYHYLPLSVYLCLSVNMSAGEGLVAEAERAGDKWEALPLSHITTQLMFIPWGFGAFPVFKRSEQCTLTMVARATSDHHLVL